MNKLKLEIIGLTFSQTQSGAYALVLGEEEGNRRLPIIIGGYEAQAIAVELENMQPSRPLTHDLFRNFSGEFQIHITEVIIYNLKEGIFYAKLLAQRDGESEVHEIDARTSDAVALAVRFNCPIYTYTWILESAGVVMDENSPDTPTEKTPRKRISEDKKAEKSSPKKGNEFTSLSIDDLKEALMKAIDDEAYETASRIRDEINRRRTQGD